MLQSKIEFKDWPSELTFMLEKYPPELMPELYFEYLLLKDAMYYKGFSWAETDPFVYGLIRRMEFENFTFDIYGFERND